MRIKNYKNLNAAQQTQRDTSPYPQLDETATQPYLADQKIQTARLERKCGTSDDMIHDGSSIHLIEETDSVASRDGCL